nr:retrovirus-related Pol polyprotein from transposon TNT 1-94 [Tanacetum cinerariifolium]
MGGYCKDNILRLRQGENPLGQMSRHLVYRVETWDVEKFFLDFMKTDSLLRAGLQAFKGALNTQCASNILDPLSHKLNDENVFLEFQVMSLEKENEHLKSIYQNLFDSVKQTQAQTKLKIDSLQEKLNDTIYENAMLRQQLHGKFNKIDKEKVVYAMCKQCLITVNHDVYVLNYVNDVNSCDNTQSANVSNNVNQKIHKAKSRRSKKLGSKESLASPRNLQANGFQTLPLFLVGYQDFIWCIDLGCSKHMTGNLKLLINFVWNFMRTVRFGNNYVAAILDYANGVVKRRNQTLVEVARTMLIFYCAPLFLWAEAIATACCTQYRFLIRRRYNETPYELINEKKPDILFLHVLGALCYPKDDGKDIRKLGAKGDIGFFLCYSATSCAYIIYNRRTKKIMEMMNVTFDELITMSFEQRSLKLEL